MNNLHHGGLMRCCVQDFWEQLEDDSFFGGRVREMGCICTSCCNQYIERRPDGDWQWVGLDRQQEMEERE